MILHRFVATVCCVDCEDTVQPLAAYVTATHACKSKAVAIDLVAEQPVVCYVERKPGNVYCEA